MQKHIDDNSSNVAQPPIERAPARLPLRDDQTPMEAAAQAALQSEATWRKYYDGLTEEGRRGVWRQYYERIHTADGETVVSQVRPQNKEFFTRNNQLRSLAVGLTGGSLVIILFAFTLFNEMVIAPFIRPGQATAISPVVDETGILADPSPKIRIPKINVEIPIVYGLGMTDAKQFELALDQGVVHYPTTSLPGQTGNSAFFGHSSNNIFNPGKYKFAFVLLHELTPGDTFSVTYNGTLYTYEVISRRVVKPTEIGVLGSVAGQLATATLITCDPPGTSTNRLVVVGKQIGPDLTGGEMLPDAVSGEATEPSSLDNLPGNGPGLLNRLWRSVFGE